MGLTKDQIVREAIALLREGGIGEVSLRKLAARLDVRAPSLAWHVGDKESLLTFMSERLYSSCLEAMPSCASWDEWLFEFGMALWESQCRTRDSARLIAMAALDPGQFDRMREATVTPLIQFGLSPELAMQMQSSVQAHITGWTIFAQGAEADLLASALNIEEAASESLQALVAGWQLKVSQSASIDDPSQRSG